MSIVESSKDVLLRTGAAPILYLMIALSVVSLAIIVERLWFFSATRADLEKLARGLVERLELGDTEGARAIVVHGRSAEATIVAAGLRQFERGPDAVEEAMAGASALARMRLERRLMFLGTLGNNAPFIGLLGTVIGIVQAFQSLESHGAGASSQVMGAISEALVATAIGLAVAIPAVVAFNYFQRRIRGVLANSEALSHVLLSFLKSRPVPGHGATSREAGPPSYARRSGEERPTPIN